jgi:hypothetical protein
LLLEGDEAGYFPVFLGHPDHVGLHPGIIETQAPGELYGAGDVFRAALSDAHFRLLYHARGRLRRAEIIRIRRRRFLLD